MIFFFFRPGWSCDHPGSNMEPPVKLRINIILDPPSFQLPSLKIPCLQKILYRSDDAFSRLLSGCPALEYLTVSFTRRFGWCHQF